MTETQKKKTPLNLIAPGLEDDRFLLKTLDQNSDPTTYGIGWPQIVSPRTAEEFEGHGGRNTVIPSFAAYMDEAWRKLHTSNPRKPLEREANRTLVLLSGPGMGKTTLAQKLAHAIGGKLFVIPCYDKEISELIAETTVDGHHKWSQLEKTINDKIKDGTLQSTSKNVIKEKFGDRLKEDGTIDFGKEVETPAVSGTERMAALKEIAELEGIISRGSNLVTKVPGPLFYALKKAKESRVPVIISLDEFTRRRDAAGGDPMLYEILAGTRGPHENVLIKGGDGQQFTLSNADLRKSNSLVLFNGNYQSARDDSIKPWPEALQSRLAPVGIGTIAQRDWAHRIQQILTGGIAVSSEYASQQARWESTGDYERETHDFGQYSQDLRTRGLSDKAKNNVAPAHFSFLGNWAKFKDGTEQLAGFMHDLAQMQNTRSSLYSDENINRTPKLNDLMDEINNLPIDHPAKQVNFELRLIQNWMEEAMRSPVPKTERGKKPQRSRAELTNPEEEFGTRLVNVLQEKIDRYYPKNDPRNEHIREYIELLMLKHGIYTPKAKPSVDPTHSDLRTAVDCRATDSIKSIAELLNTPREQGKDAAVKAWQEVLATYIQQAYPDHFESGTTIDPENVISYNAVKAVLDKISEIDKSAAGLVIPMLAIVPPAAGATDVQFSLQLAEQYAVDTKNPENVLSRLDEAVKAPVDAAWQRLVRGGKDQKQPHDPSLSRLLMTLALPGAPKTVIPKLFPDIAQREPSLLIASGKENDTQLAFTSFQTGLDADGNPETAQLLVRYKYETGADGTAQRMIDRVVLIGDEAPIPEKLANLLAKNNVYYISRKDQHAEQAIKTEVAEAIRYGEDKLRETTRKRIENSPAIKAITDEATRKKRIDNKVDSELRGLSVENLLQTALTYSTAYRGSYLDSVKGDYRELRDVTRDALPIAAADIILKSRNLPLSAMLSQMNEIFEPAQPLVLTQAAAVKRG